MKKGEYFFIKKRWILFQENTFSWRSLNTFSGEYFFIKRIGYFFKKILFQKERWILSQENTFSWRSFVVYNSHYCSKKIHPMKKVRPWPAMIQLITDLYGVMTQSWYSCNTVITQSWYSHGQSWYSHRSMNRGRNLYGDHTVDLCPITDPVHVTGTVYTSQALCKHRPWVDMINLLPPFTQTRVDLSKLLNKK